MAYADEITGSRVAMEDVANLLKGIALYSTTEQEFGEYLGSVAYKKTIVFGALPNNTTKSVAHGVSGMVKCFKCEGHTSTSASSVGTTLFLPHPDSANLNVEIQVSSTNVTAITNANYSSLISTEITIYYTKS